MWPSAETLELFTTRGFLSGLTLGTAALGIGALVARRSSRTGAVPIHGVLVVLATLLAMPAVRDVPLRLIAGLAILAAAGLAYGSMTSWPMLASASAVPGALAISFIAPLPDLGAAVWIVFAIVAVGSPLVASFDYQYQALGIGPLLFVTTSAAAFSVVPDTEELLVMLGATAPLALAGWNRIGLRIGGAGSFAVMGLYAWLIAQGGQARFSSMVGAAGAVGLFAAEPVARRLAGHRWTGLLATYSTGKVRIWAAAGHALILSVAARFAGVRSSTWEAVAISASAIGLFAFLIARQSRHTRRQPVAGDSALENHGPE